MSRTGGFPIRGRRRRQPGIRRRRCPGNVEVSGRCPGEDVSGPVAREVACAPREALHGGADPEDLHPVRAVAGAGGVADAEAGVARVEDVGAMAAGVHPPAHHGRRIRLPGGDVLTGRDPSRRRDARAPPRGRAVLEGARRSELLRPFRSGRVERGIGDEGRESRLCALGVRQGEDLAGGTTGGGRGRRREDRGTERQCERCGDRAEGADEQPSGGLAHGVDHSGCGGRSAAYR